MPDTPDQPVRSAKRSRFVDGPEEAARMLAFDKDGNQVRYVDGKRVVVRPAKPAEPRRDTPPKP